MNARMAASSSRNTASMPANPGPTMGRASLANPAVVASLTRRSIGRCSTRGLMICGTQAITLTRPAVPPARRRVSSIARCTSLARSAMSTSPTLGLATVSISAAVSPKSLMKLIGPAPSGRSAIESSFILTSSNCLPVSVTLSSSCTYTTASPPRVRDVILSTRAFCAMASSSLRVTSSSTFSAAAPGQGQSATATRTGISGSLRCGMRV